MRPPFPWNGAKTRLLDQLEGYIRAWGGTGKWVEPFLGSGVVTKQVRYWFPDTPMIVGDANPWLMAAHKHWFGGSVEPPCLADVSPQRIQFYRGMKDSDFSGLSPRDRALRFLVCLYSAWGNRWQTTPEGVFATPVNTARKGGDAEFLLRRLVESHGQGWFGPSDLLLEGSWEETLSRAEPGDLVFLDSPYPETAGYSTAWNLLDWSKMYLWVKDQAIPRGVYVLVCNPGTLSLLWEILLPCGNSSHVDPQGRSTAPRVEYIGYHGPNGDTAQPRNAFLELFGPEETPR